MKNLTFTRYLYALDECLLTLQEALLKKKSFDECIFWIGEIFYSNHPEELWNFIFEFYYNFCAIKNNSRFEKKILELYNLYSIENISKAINILFNFKKCFKVFNYFTEIKKPTKGYFGKMPKWITENITDQRKFYKIIRAVRYKNLDNISYHVNTLKDNEIAEVYNIMKKYFEYIIKKPIKYGFDIENKIYNNKLHILLAFIIKYTLMEKNNIYLTIQYNHEEYKNVLCESNIPVTLKYKTLPEKLLYPISKTIGCFPLKRFELGDINIQEAYWYSWDYFAYNCNLWRDRFNKFNIKINSKNKNIEFLSSEAYDDFYDIYFYEPDEQSTETQNKSIPEIKKITFEEWCKLMTNEI
tara:strand:+ start:394 stop:1458 length:1065 start_codon:yes stop_codon:yes gene_type:complete